MRRSLFTAAILLALTAGPVYLRAQSPAPTFEIQGTKTKLTGVLIDAKDLEKATPRSAAASPAHQPIKIVRAVDASSPLLFKSCTTGEKLGTVTFKVYKPGDPTKFKYVTLKDAIITKIEPVSWSGAHDDSGPAEKITFQFGKVEIKYGEQKASDGDF